MSSDGSEIPVSATSAAPLTAAAVEPAPTADLQPGFSPEIAALAKAVDDSLLLPVILFFSSALSWLLMGSALAAVAAFKLNVPGFLAAVPWLTFGRLHPAATNALLYGWSLPAGIGIGLWILARLGRVPLRNHGILTAAWVLWNLGVTLGEAAILYGDGTSYEGLEYPRYVSPLLFLGFIFVAMWALLLFRNRHERTAYISQWYALAGFLWFPWTYATANILVFFLPVQAPARAIVAAWYTHNLVGTVLVPLALATAYYIVPKATGQPIHRYGWARVGFWSWLLFAGWSGGFSLVGGPVPAWILSVSIVATVLALVPMTAILTNLRGLSTDHPTSVRYSPSYRFVAMALSCLLAAVLFFAFSAFRGVNEIFHFTLLMGAGSELLGYGFVSMVFFGGIYYMMPRLLATEWESPALIRAHFWLSITGVGLSVVACALGGLVQGLGLDDPKVPMIAVLSLAKPFLAADFVAWCVMTAGHVCFAASFIFIFLRLAWESEAFKRTTFVIQSARPKHLSTGHVPEAAVSTATLS